MAYLGATYAELVDADEATGTAAARSYVTVLQAVDGLPPQAVAAGRHHDRFARLGGAWRFTERRVHIRLVRDTSRHLRRSLVWERAPRGRHAACRPFSRTPSSPGPPPYWTAPAWANSVSRRSRCCAV
ncbi:nuclear transport factor 2 family protein [Streptomyces sp. NPDC016845]|uniref:nuclear transport factor 2 family protein n=1 Tax=Streptomyces sp. NPDC016845 TaxID=3364972 RepID=UPI0037A76B61